jgi:hypothetical protein
VALTVSIKKVAIFIFAFGVFTQITFAQISSLMDGNAWRRMSKPERAGIVFGICIQSMLINSYLSQLNYKEASELVREFFMLKGTQTMRQIITAMDELYEDPENTVISIHLICHVALLKTKGELNEEFYAGYLSLMRENAKRAQNWENLFGDMYKKFRIKLR